MNQNELIKKITSKKEFSALPEIDVNKAFAQFDLEKYTDEEKIKLTRDLLRKVFSAFTSQKILNLKDKDSEWILKKHLSTRERFNHYPELYNRILKNKNATIIDLGAGVNGFSLNFMKKVSWKGKYLSVEAIGQFINLMNFYFKKNKLNAQAIHLSLFELEKIKNLIKKEKGEKIVFLFKTLDSLEMLERNYSKKLLLEIAPLVNKVVVSFATRSMVSRKKFMVNRGWIVNFIEDNFKILDDFELGGERYIIINK